MESPQQPTSAHAKYRMSWTAYVRPVIVFLVLLFVGIALVGTSNWFAAIMITIAIGLFAFNVLSIRSLVLYTDDHGVWVYSGILPWSRGMSGVKWRDLEDATYFTSFFSWLFKSYTIRVGHRFTKTSEIVLPHIACGHDAVVHINELHRKALSGGTIERMT
jgi:hypothetical protein